jgi:hypothetical protein
MGPQYTVSPRFSTYQFPLNMMYKDQTEVDAKAQELKDAGWTVVPCDFPDRGLRGSIAFRTVDGEEEQQELHWPIFGKELTPKYQQGSIPGLLQMFRENKGLICDDPKTRRLGYMVPDLEKAEANIYVVSLTELKRHPLGKEAYDARQVILDAQRQAS